MASTSITVRMDEDLKSQVEVLFSDMGLNMTTAFTLFAKAVVRQNKIPFDIAADKPPSISVMANTKKVSRKEKESAFMMLNGILAGHEVDLEQEREERILSK